MSSVADHGDSRHVDFDEWVRKLEQDPVEREAIEEARERLRRELGEGDEPAMAG